MKRYLTPERMDALDLDSQEHRRALNGLARINRLCDSSRHIVTAIRNEIPSREPLRVLDIGCGSGDVTAKVAQRLTKLGFLGEVIGLDRSPNAVATARERLAGVPQGGMTLAFECGDVFQLQDEKSPREFDVVFCSLFLHHFKLDEAIELLRTARRLAGRLVVVDDLIRCWRGYFLAQVGCRLLSRSPIVHFDGPQSVRAAYTTDEIIQICREERFDIKFLRTHWPARYLLAF